MIFLICPTLHGICFPFILFNKLYVYINFYYKINLINKFIKHNRINDLCCAIKYLDLYLFFYFWNFVFTYYQIFFYLIILTSLFRTRDKYTILIYLMSMLCISRVNLTLTRTIFFFIYFLLLPYIFYFIKLIKN
jgi:hypothetical protein